jgi:hypothetical protein
MSSDTSFDEKASLDEGSWVYLCASVGQGGGERHLQRRVIEACEESGWLAICWSSSARAKEADPGRFFQGVSHAVGHADVVVAFIDEGEDLADIELALAFSHRRPIVGVNLAENLPSNIQAMLNGYERARVVNCSSADECFTGLRETLADPDFSETIRLAAGEHVADV